MGVCVWVLCVCECGCCMCWCCVCVCGYCVFVGVDCVYVLCVSMGVERVLVGVIYEEVLCVFACCVCGIVFPISSFSRLFALIAEE